MCFDNVLATKADKVVILRDDLEWLEQEHEREELKDYWKGKKRFAKETQMDELVTLAKNLLKQLDRAEHQQSYLKSRMKRHFHSLVLL